MSVGTVDFGSIIANARVLVYQTVLVIPGRLAGLKSGIRDELHVFRQVNFKLPFAAIGGERARFTNNALEEDGIVNMTSRFKLPAHAHNARLATGSDDDHLIYSLKVSRSKPKLLLYVGLLLLVAAAVPGTLSFRPSRAEAALSP